MSKQRSIGGYLHKTEPKSLFGIAVRRQLGRVVVPSSLLRAENSRPAVLENPGPGTGQSKGKKRKSRTVNVNHEDIAEQIPLLSLHSNFLDADLAAAAAQYFLDDTSGYVNREFYIAGQIRHTDHAQCAYARYEDQRESYYFGKKQDVRPYNAMLDAIESQIAQKVNFEISQRRRFRYQSKDPWEGDYCVVNKYETKDKRIDWHSDRLNYLGPHCVIASLSLGATRPFCVRNYVKDDGEYQTTYTIALPHNSLAIMHAGFQEQYQHCVKSSQNSNVNYCPHALTGQTRINLTFRHHIYGTEDIEVCDRCGSYMTLRTVTHGENTGKYIWLCGKSQNSEQECKGIKWWDETKAKR